MNLDVLGKGRNDLILVVIGYLEHPLQLENQNPIRPCQEEKNLSLQMTSSILGEARNQIPCK